MTYVGDAVPTVVDWPQGDSFATLTEERSTLFYFPSKDFQEEDVPMCHCLPIS